MTDEKTPAEVVAFPTAVNQEIHPNFYGRTDKVVAISCGDCPNKNFKIRAYNDHPYVIECSECGCIIDLSEIELKQWT